MKSANPKTDQTSGTAESAPPPNFDTMDTMEMLMQAGFGHGQARAIVGAVRGAQSELATKTDLRELETNLRGDLRQLEANFRGEIQNQSSQFYWRLIVGASIISTAMIGIFGLMITFMGVS